MLYHILTERSRQKLIAWLSALDFVSRQQDTYEKRADHTGGWFLEYKQVQQWITGARRRLWVQGGRKSFALQNNYSTDKAVAGVGKSVLS